MFQIKPTRIKREDLSSLTFPKNALEHTPEKLSYLKKAVLKASAYTKHVRIIFFDAIGLKEIEADEWNSNGTQVILNDGTSIPFNRLVDIEIS